MHISVIAEVGVNHNGCVEKALALIEAAADAGADAVKFQTFSADRLVAKGTPTAEYQKQETGQLDQYQLLKQLELPIEAYPKLIDHCNALGIEFLSTPFDEQAADFLISLGVKKIKVSSGELTNLAFLKYLAQKQLPLIVSTGMTTLNEVETAVQCILKEMDRRSFRKKDRLTLLHCTSNYPAPIETVNLRSIAFLKDVFKLPVGYSDHTQGIEIPILAVASGACLLEKHFTLDRNLPGPDHKVSLEPGELKAMVTQVRRLEVILGNYDKRPQPSELPIQKVVRKSVAASKFLPQGTIIAYEDLILLRPGDGIPCQDLEKLIGRQLTCDVESHQLLSWEQIK